MKLLLSQIHSVISTAQRHHPSPVTGKSLIPDPFPVLEFIRYYQNNRRTNEDQRHGHHIWEGEAHLRGSSLPRFGPPLLPVSFADGMSWGRADGSAARRRLGGTGRWCRGGGVGRRGRGAVAPDPDPLGAGWGDEVDRGRSEGYGRRGLGFGGVMGAPAGPAWLAQWPAGPRPSGGGSFPFFLFLFPFLLFIFIFLFCFILDTHCF